MLAQELPSAAANGLGAADQAAGLRRWAESQGLAAPVEASAVEASAVAPSVELPAHVADAFARMHGSTPAPAPTLASAPAPAPAAPPVTLMVVGLDGQGVEQVARVHQALQRWHANGYAWVGDPARWRVVALASDSPHLATLASQQARWALWVDRDLNSFRRAYLTLRQLHAHGGPQRLLVLHDGIASHAGLLGNLRQAAANFLGVELLLLAEQPAALR